MNTFRVGEIAIIAHSHLRDFPVGMEVVVLSELELAPSQAGGEMCYRIYDTSERKVWARPCDLRKKPPDEDDATPNAKVSWSDGVPWWPEALARAIQ